MRLRSKGLFVAIDTVETFDHRCVVAKLTDADAGRMSRKLGLGAVKAIESSWSMACDRRRIRRNSSRRSSHHLPGTSIDEELIAKIQWTADLDIILSAERRDFFSETKRRARQEFEACGRMIGRVIEVAHECDIRQCGRWQK